MTKTINRGDKIREYIPNIADHEILAVEMAYEWLEQMSGETEWSVFDLLSEEERYQSLHTLLTKGLIYIEMEEPEGDEVLGPWRLATRNPEIIQQACEMEDKADGK